MPIEKINGVKLYWELNGSEGDPLVLVHGSWGDHHNWDMVTGDLAKTFRVFTYDRRGHSQSERLPGLGSTAEDVDDLVAFIDHFDLAPAHVAGNSFGASIVLKTVVKQPDLFRSMVIHEPPLFDILKNNPGAAKALEILNTRIKAVLGLFEAGRPEKAAEAFMENIALGEGEWEKLPETLQSTFIYNAPTWYDETQDPQALQLDTGALVNYRQPALFTCGSASPPFFPLVIRELQRAVPHAKQVTIDGAGHVPHMSHAGNFVQLVRDFCLDG